MFTRAIVGIALTLIIAIGGAFLMHASIDPVEEAETEAATPARGASLSLVASWGYQLQGLDVAAAARSGTDLLVVDATLNRTDRPEHLVQAVRSLKIKPDGG